MKPWEELRYNGKSHPVQLQFKFKRMSGNAYYTHSILWAYFVHVNE